MSNPIVIEQLSETKRQASRRSPSVQPLWGNGSTETVPTMFVSGANLPAVSEAREVRNSQSLVVRDADDAQYYLPGTDDESLAYNAAQALRRWTMHNRESLINQRSPELDFVRECVARVVTESRGADGVSAWVRLDGDRPSVRTIQEYRGTARDVLIYLASRGISPAEASAADMKAFKAFLQADGAPKTMELLRAKFFQREPRIFTVSDWRGLAGWAACRGYAVARLEVWKTQTAIDKSSKKSTASLARLNQQAQQLAARWLQLVTVVLATYTNAPLQPKYERYTSDTVSLRITLARSFFKMAMSRQCASDVNPLLEIRVGKNGTGRAQKIISRYFSDDEVLRILNVCDEANAHGPRHKALAARNTAIIRLGRTLGLRISEVTKLDVSDFDASAGKRGSLSIRHAKGDKFRTVFLTDKTRAAIESWMLYRALVNPNTEALFVALNYGGMAQNETPGARMTDRGVRGMFDDIQKSLGIKKAGRSFHGLRHSYATSILMKDKSQLISVSMSMGHAGTQVTMGYVEAAQLIGENPAELAEI
jgi:integrase